MFILHYLNGQTITENEMVWNDVPEDIVNLQLTLPVSFKIKDRETGEVVDAPAPAITLGKYDAYYFENEATAIVMATAMGKIEGFDTKGVKVAQIIGGIDEASGIVTQIRVDKYCNIEISKFPLSQLESTRRIKKSIKKVEHN